MKLLYHALVFVIFPICILVEAAVILFCLHDGSPASIVMAVFACAVLLRMIRDEIKIIQQDSEQRRLIDERRRESRRRNDERKAAGST